MRRVATPVSWTKLATSLTILLVYAMSSVSLSLSLYQMESAQKSSYLWLRRLETQSARVCGQTVGSGRKKEIRIGLTRVDIFAPERVLCPETRALGAPRGGAGVSGDPVIRFFFSKDPKKMTGTFLWRLECVSLSIAWHASMTRKI